MEVIETYGNFTLFRSNKPLFSYKKEKIENLDEFVTIYSVSEMNIHLIVKGYNPIKPEDGFLHMVVWRSQGMSKFQFKLITVVDPGEFEVKAYITPPVVFTYPYILIEFFVSDSIGGKPIKRIPIKVIDNSFAMTLLNYNQFSPFYKQLILPEFFFPQLPPRVIGVYQRMRRNIQVWGSAVAQAGRKLFVLAVKTGGSSCPFHGHSSDPSTSLSRDDSYRNLDTITYQADNWCSKCFGTGMLGAFDYIKIAYGGLFIVSTVNQYGEFENVGRVIIEAGTPIKPGDYVTDLNDVYVVKPPVEVKEFYELPLYYTAPIEVLPALNPISRIIATILRNFDDYLWRYRLPTDKLYEQGEIG